jgi:hypothetical protein
VRGDELLVAARRSGIQIDLSAARVARQAAVRLATNDRRSDAGRAAAQEVAHALVAMALSGDSDSLAAFLSPRPQGEGNTWTVACYQYGDLTPSALRDYGDPIDAMGALVACEEVGHVAAELLASTPDGIRWAALYRSGDALAFQLPSRETSAAADPDRPELLSAVLRAWQEQLGHWACEDQPPIVLPGATPERTSGLASPALERRFDDLVHTLGALEQRVAELTRALSQLASVPPALPVAPPSVHTTVVNVASPAPEPRLDATVISVASPPDNRGEAATWGHLAALAGRRVRRRLETWLG